MELYDPLKLDNQLCFPLYACSKEIIRRYTPFLDEIGLTYTQYIAMMVMWEHKELTSKEMGEYLFLNSGTLTPVLKTLESKGYITRHRSKEDERNLVVSITEEGMALRERALSIPKQMRSCFDLSVKDAAQLYRILHKIMKQIN